MGVARWLWNACLRFSGKAIGSVLRVVIRRGFVHFPFLSELLGCIPFSFGWKLRESIYRELLPQFGRDVVLHFGVVIEDPRTCLGSDVWVSRSAYIEYAVIGDSVLIGPHACILAGKQHHRTDRLDIPIKSQGNPEKEPIQIGRGVWIGASAVVMASVGDDAIVGAGSVVTRQVPPRSVVVGNPARVLRLRTDAALDPGPV